MVGPARSLVRPLLTFLGVAIVLLLVLSRLGGIGSLELVLILLTASVVAVAVARFVGRPSS
jgi:hypothetical protein